MLLAIFHKTCYEIVVKRDIYRQLLAWKESSSRKPLALNGARKVGKTYILKKFGEKEYNNVAYFNFEEDPDLNDFFTGILSPEKIIDSLSIYIGSRISSDKTLIIFDEISSSPQTLTSLKYFCENAPEYNIVTADSLLGVNTEKVNSLDMHPMSFGEFLDAIGKNQLRLFIEEKQDFYPIPKSFHTELINFLKLYYFVGGMPEAIRQYVKDKNFNNVRKIQDQILSSYTIDFSRYTSKTKAIRISNIWATIPIQLSKENKKFTFNQVNKNARAREYYESIQWLVDAGLVKKVNNIKTPKLPISGYQNNKFKLYLLDIGLLGAMIKVPQKSIIKGDYLFSKYNGAFVENFAAQEFTAHGQKDLYYWSSKKTAEVGFVVGFKNQILPLEVKAEISKQKKSLRVYGEKFKPSVLSRSTLMNFKEDGKVRDYPLYAVSLFLKEY